MPGCTDDIVTSDHSPVFATFEVGVTSQFVPKKGKDKGTGSVPHWDSAPIENPHVLQLLALALSPWPASSGTASR